MKQYYYGGFEVLTAVVMKSSTFWDSKQRTPLKVNRRFGGISRLYLQCRIRQARNHREAGSKQSAAFNGPPADYTLLYRRK
jgi:hypothetical protein